MEEIAAIIDIDLGDYNINILQGNYDPRFAIQVPNFGWKSIHYLAREAIRKYFL